MKTAEDIFRVEYFVEEYKRHLQHLEKEGSEDYLDEEDNLDMYISCVISGSNGWRTSYCFLELFEATEGMVEDDEWVYEEIYRLMSVIGEQLNTAVVKLLKAEGIDMLGMFYITFAEDGDIAVHYYRDFNLE